MIKHWGPRPEALNYVSGLIPATATVLEIGPGHIPFSRSTHFVDRFVRGPSCSVVNVCKEVLPFEDKSFDFVFCRHVVEDLYNPFLLLSEMSRVGRAGYIETPSPIAELNRGVDFGTPPWRGYHHHKSIVWADNGALWLVEKSPLIEHLELPDNSEELADPFSWNTYLLWTDEIKVNHYEHDIYFKLYDDYEDVLLNATHLARENIQEFHDRCI